MARHQARVRPGQSEQRGRARHQFENGGYKEERIGEVRRRAAYAAKLRALER